MDNKIFKDKDIKRAFTIKKSDDTTVKSEELKETHHVFEVNCPPITIENSKLSVRFDNGKYKIKIKGPNNN